MDYLLTKLVTYIEKGLETPKIDLKSTLCLKHNEQKAEFAKDVAAIANTDQNEGYIIIGVLDQKQRDDKGEEYILGVDVDEFNQDKAELKMNQIVNRFIEPPPKIKFFLLIYAGKKLGIVEISPSQNRPHMIKRDSGEVKQDMIYIRKGTGTYPANRDDVLKMAGDYWQMRLEDVKELLTAQLQEREKDERDNYFIAWQACQKLYHKLPKSNRDMVIKKILVNRPHYFTEWGLGEK